MGDHNPMTTCIGSGPKNTHEEIIYDYGFCPLCQAIEEKEEIEEQLRRTEEKLRDAEPSPESENPGRLDWRQPRE